MITGVIDDIDEFHYYYQDSSNIDLDSAHCSASQTGYDCSLATEDTTYNMAPDGIRNATITVTWDAVEISSGPFAQADNNGDHVIQCWARRNTVTRESTVTIRGK